MAMDANSASCCLCVSDVRFTRFECDGDGYLRPVNDRIYREWLSLISVNPSISSSSRNIALFAMPCLRLLALVIMTTLTAAAPSSPDEVLNKPEDEWLLSDTTTSPPATTDYRTMPPGTYTETKTDGSVLVIIVTMPAQTETSLPPMPTCPIECDCSRIEDKESEEYVVVRLLVLDLHRIGISSALQTQTAGFVNLEPVYSRCMRTKPTLCNCISLPGPLVHVSDSSHGTRHGCVVVLFVFYTRP